MEGTKKLFMQESMQRGVLLFLIKDVNTKKQVCMLASSKFASEDETRLYARVLLALAENGVPKDVLKEIKNRWPLV